MNIWVATVGETVYDEYGTFDRYESNIIGAYTNVTAAIDSVLNHGDTKWIHDSENNTFSDEDGNCAWITMLSVEDKYTPNNN